MSAERLMGLDKYYGDLLDNNRTAVMAEQARETQCQLGLDEFDTTYDHFLWDHVGDPFDPRHTPTAMRMHGDIAVDYPNRGYFGLTDTGRLAVVRTTPELDPGMPEAYYVVTADINRCEVVLWHTTMVQRASSGGVTLLLSQYAQAPGSTFESRVLPAEIDPVGVLLSGWRQEATQREEALRQAKLRITAGECLLTLPNGIPEHLIPMSREFTAAQDALRKWRVGYRLMSLLVPNTPVIAPVPATLDR